MFETEFLPLLRELVDSNYLSVANLGNKLDSFKNYLQQLEVDFNQTDSKIVLTDDIQLLNPMQLEQDLQHCFEHDELILDYFIEIDSTNRVARQSPLEPGQVSVVVSEQQNQGRGRLQRNWFSPFGKNIYCSIGLTKTIPPELVGNISILTGLALAQVLIDLGVKNVKLKWPNDLLVNSKKIGGILIESRPLAADRFYFVIGFGLNLLMTKQDLQQISQPATSLLEIGLTRINKKQILMATIQSVFRAIKSYSGQNKTQVGQAFEQLDAFKKQLITLNTSQGQLKGINLGIDKFAALKLETADGLKLINAAEIVGGE